MSRALTQSTEGLKSEVLLVLCVRWQDTHQIWYMPGSIISAWYVRYDYLQCMTMGIHVVLVAYVWCMLARLRATICGKPQIYAHHARTEICSIYTCVFWTNRCFWYIVAYLVRTMSRLSMKCRVQYPFLLFVCCPPLCWPARTTMLLKLGPKHNQQLYGWVIFV